MKTGDVEFRFPVLGLTPDLDLWGFADVRGLTTCGPRTLKDDMQVGMELVDCAGRRWVVRSVRRVGLTGSLPSRLVRKLLFGLPQFRVEHEVEALPSLSVSEVQRRVCAGIEAHPEFWCEDDERETVLPQRLEEVRAAKDFAQIHELLGLDTFEAY